jgi:hypothetical protein
MTTAITYHGLKDSVTAGGFVLLVYNVNNSTALTHSRMTNTLQDVIAL